MNYYSIKVIETYRGRQNNFTFICKAEDEKKVCEKIETKLIRWCGNSLSKVKPYIIDRKKIDTNVIWDEYFHEEDTLSVSLIGYVEITEEEFKILRKYLSSEYEIY